MYIRHLKVENLKRLRSFELDFLHDGQPRMWTVLIGENGTAKTTLLQAVALAAAGFRDVSGLAGSAIKNLQDRRGEETMSIEATFMFGDKSRQAGATAHPLLEGTHGRVPKETVLTSRVALPYGVTSLDAEAFYGTDGLKKDQRDPLSEARATNRPFWFVSGYGIARVLPGANVTPELARPAIERLEPLFGQKQLASIGFANHFLQKDQKEGRKKGTTSRLFSNLLNQAVKMGGADLFPGLARLELRGYGGASSGAALIESDRFYQRMAAGHDPVAIAGIALSHGYQSTFAWIADLIGHVLLESPGEIKTTQMEGLVLIDEIDLYLHPTWQANFIPALRRVFPRMQFVATTHSPVVLSSLAPHEIVRLVVDEATGDVVRGGWSRNAGQFRPGIDDAEHQPDPRTMTGGELYRTWFGLEGMTPNPVGEKLRKLQVLSSHPAPTPTQRKELRQLRSEVQKEFQERLGVKEGKQALKDFREDRSGGRVIRIDRGRNPGGLATAAPRRLEEAAKRFNQQGAPSRELSDALSGYDARATKLALYQAQYGKCAWCETSTPFSSAPVEHYRPKGGAWRNLPGEPLQVDPGHYWWLTWTWTNLLFSCVTCNDQGHKANYFPLRKGTAAAATPVAPLSLSPPLSVGDVSGEQPVLLDPAGFVDPLDHIEWLPSKRTFDRRDWTWTPLAKTDEGQATLRILHLEELADRLQGHVRTRLLPSIEEIEDHLSEGRSLAAHRRWRRLLEDNLSPKAEWSAFTWHALGYLMPEAYRLKHGLDAMARPGAI